MSSPSAPTQTPEAAATKLSDADEAEVAALVSRLNDATFTLWSKLTRPPAFRPVGDAPVILSTWMKSGTTMLQQLVYQLFVTTGRVPSDPTGTDFDEISDVVPTIELTGPGGPTKPIHEYLPTAWKTHADASELAGPNYHTARYIVVVRDGRKTFRSFSNYAPTFFCGMHVPQHLHARFYDALFRSFFLRADVEHVPPIENDYQYRPWFDYVKAWRDSDAVHGRTLFIVFEDMVRDMPSTVRMVARFLEVDASDEIVARVAHRCSKQYMAGDPKFNSRVAARTLGLDMDAGVRVRPDADSGFADVLSEQTAAEYDRMFRDAFAVDSYEQLCEQLRKRSRQVLN